MPAYTVFVCVCVCVGGGGGGGGGEGEGEGGSLQLVEKIVLYNGTKHEYISLV